MGQLVSSKEISRSSDHLPDNLAGQTGAQTMAGRSVEDTDYTLIRTA